MNNVSINNQNLVNSPEYQEFLKNNPGRGYLNIRVYTASQARPISNLKVVVSTVIGANNVIFFEGYSDSSGIIETIDLPTPKLKFNDLTIPNSMSYNILATYTPDNVSENFIVEMYENVNVIQNINIAPINQEEY